MRDVYEVIDVIAAREPQQTGLIQLLVAKPDEAVVLHGPALYERKPARPQCLVHEFDEKRRVCKGCGLTKAEFFLRKGQV